MADYVSKYTGSEVDGILDEAIELPSLPNIIEDDKFLKYDVESSSLTWDDVNYTMEYFLSNIIGNGGASSGQVLKYTSGTHPVTWGDSVDTSYATNGDFLKYSSTTGLYWTNPIDTSAAQNGDFLRYSSDTGLVWETPIDTYGANNGDVLKYDSNDGLVWDTPIDTYGANNGDVLKYDSNDGLVWDTPIDTTEAYDGAVLKYSDNDGLYWTSLIDTSNANYGDFLQYTADSGIAWTQVDVLPTVDSHDAGKILMATEFGPAWENNPLDGSDADTDYIFTYDSSSGTGQWSDFQSVLFSVTTQSGIATTGSILYAADSNLLGWTSINELLDTEHASDGDILKYSSNSGLMWTTVIPSNGDTGDVLSLGAQGPEWISMNEIPDPDYEGFLYVNDSGEMFWTGLEHVLVPRGGVSADACLKYDNNDGFYWADPIDYSQANEGDILKIVSGVPTWTAP